jgi:hypothetical protein
MSHDGSGARAPQGQRQAAIDRLMEAFADDALDVEEFERRLDRAHAATTSEELKSLLSDLPGQAGLPVPLSESGSTSPTPRREYTVAAEGQVKESQFVVAVMGGSSRRGHWRPARKNYAVAVMGGTELDFREAVLPPGVTEVQVWTMWGGVEIVVPPGVNVESHGIALLGGFDHAGTAAADLDPLAPTIRITGVAVMAGVDISVRHAGETARDARRRRRVEKREQQRRLRSGD